MAVSFSAEAHPLLCITRESLIEKLETRYNETTQGMGLASNGLVFELTASEDMRTWTLLYTTPDGVSCVVATGELWSREEKKPEGKGT